MAKVNFTAARVEAHKCPAGKSQAFLWDSDTPGLGLRATGGGSKSYIFQGKFNGATLRLTIGGPDSWPIESQYQKVDGERREIARGARQEARRLQTLIDGGIDPREHKADMRAAHAARQAEARRQDATFAEAWDAYLINRKPRWSERHYADHVDLASKGGTPRKRGKGVMMAGPLAQLRPIQLSALTGERIAQWLESQSIERPTRAALAYRLLRAFIRWAADTPEFRDTIPLDGYRARDVKDALPAGRAKDGDCLQREQLPEWFASVRKIGNPVISSYLQGLLITGARREEMAALKWVDVDFQWRALSIADKVEDAGRVIPLTPYLASLLLDLKRINDTPPNVHELAQMRERGEKWTPSPWVFSSAASADGKIAEPRIAHNQALVAAGLPHLTLHGLRRSFGTLSEWCEVPVGIVAQLQGHKPSAIAEKHYRRRPLDLLRQWHDKIEAWMLEQAGIAFEVEQAPGALRAVK